MNLFLSRQKSSLLINKPSQFAPRIMTQKNAEKSRQDAVESLRVNSDFRQRIV